MKKKKSWFGIFGGAGIITAAALVSKAIGALYRIPLTRVIGGQGMGLYQSVFPTYALIVTLTGGGLCSAVSKLTAERGENADKSACVFAALCLSVPVTLTALLLCRTVARISGAPSAASALAVLTLSVPLSAVGAALRGYCLGKNAVSRSALGQLVEQTVKLAVGLTLAALLMRKSLAAAVAGCAAGVAASEAVTVLFYALVCSKKFDGKRLGEAEKGIAGDESSLATSALSAVNEVSAGEERDIIANAEASAELAPAAGETSAVAADVRARGKMREAATFALKLVKLSLPITFGLAVLPLCAVADSFTVVNILTAAGESAENATALYGVATGPVASLVALPSVFSVGLCSLLLPKISRMSARGECVRKTAMSAVGLSALFGFACAGIFAVAAPFMLETLYGSSLGVELGTAVKLLRIAAAGVPLSMTVSACTAVLQGVGKPLVPGLVLLVSAAFKELAAVLLIPRVGILGFAVSGVAVYLISCIADIVFVLASSRQAAEKTRVNS